jgi:hypothetical protein
MSGISGERCANTYLCGVFGLIVLMQEFDVLGDDFFRVLIDADDMLIERSMHCKWKRRTRVLLAGCLSLVGGPQPWLPASACVPISAGHALRSLDFPLLKWTRA